MSLSNGMRMELSKYGVDVILFNPGDHPGETPLCFGQNTYYKVSRVHCGRNLDSIFSEFCENCYTNCTLSLVSPEHKFKKWGQHTAKIHL